MDPWSLTWPLTSKRKTTIRLGRPVPFYPFFRLPKKNGEKRLFNFRGCRYVANYRRLRSQLPMGHGTFFSLGNNTQFPATHPLSKLKCHFGASELVFCSSRKKFACRTIQKPETSQASSKKIDIQEKRPLTSTGNSTVMVPMIPMLWSKEILMWNF